MKWGKLLRRSGALFLATLALWWLMITSDLGAARSRLMAAADFHSPSVTAAPAKLNGWVRLLVNQSPYLQAGYVLRGSSPGSQADDQPAPSESPSPSPSAAAEDEPIPSPAAGSENIVAQTFRPTGSPAYSSAQGVFVYNRTHLALDMEQLAKTPVVLTGNGKGPQILIVHTHATESYTQGGQDVYEESDPYRTTDDAHNVVRVGDEMAAAFAQAGLNVLHDRTLHDYPSYNGAYGRSHTTVEEYLAAYPSISIVLDVHRDALSGEDGTVYKAVADQSILPGAAQIMLVVGSNESNGAHTDWEQNLAFAIALERALNQEAPTLARPITLRSSSYNQQLSVGSLLVEVGTHGNSLQEATTAARLFAQTAAPYFLEILPKS